MKRWIGIACGVLMGWAAAAQSPIGDSPEPARVVTICLETQTPTLRAERVAADIFATIGVTLNWVRPGRDCPADSIRVALTRYTPDTLLPGALAYAKPYQGSEIRIFIDRVASACDYPPKLCGRILGHVMAHEIGHMLQGVSRHSSEGVMKPKWNPGDFATMRMKLLPFIPLDVGLIHLGADARAARSPVPITQ
jgi:hypothetical protein